MYKLTVEEVLGQSHFEVSKVVVFREEVELDVYLTDVLREVCTYKASLGTIYFEIEKDNLVVCLGVVKDGKPIISLTYGMQDIIDKEVEDKKRKEEAWMKSQVLSLIAWCGNIEDQKTTKKFRSL